MLPSDTFSQSAVLICRDLLGTLEEHGKLKTLSCVLPSGREVFLEANHDGKFSSDSLKPMFKKLGVHFPKFPGFQVNTIP